MQRVFIMLRIFLDESLKGEEDLSRASTVQRMKARPQHILDLTWRTARPLTLFEGPLSLGRQGGMEHGMKAILSYLRAQDDLRHRGRQFGDVLEQVSDAEGEVSGRQGQQRNGKAPKAKSKGKGDSKGGERGADAAQADS